MKKIIAVSSFVLFFAITGLAQTPCKRHTEAAGRFSFCPPEEWTSKDSTSGSPYKVWLTPEISAIRANMNVKDEATTMSHSEYMAAALKFLLADNASRGEEATKVIGWTEFATSSNLRGSRMVYERLYKGLHMRTIQYIFDLPGKKLLFTGTALASSKETTDPIFDAAVKTLKTY